MLLLDFHLNVFILNGLSKNRDTFRPTVHTFQSKKSQHLAGSETVCFKIRKILLFTWKGMCQLFLFTFRLAFKWVLSPGSSNTTSDAYSKLIHMRFMITALCNAFKFSWYKISNTPWLRLHWFFFSRFSFVYAVCMCNVHNLSAFNRLMRKSIVIVCI